jgi:peptidyl-prolyl cis-trans isomerase SurA
MRKILGEEVRIALAAALLAAAAAHGLPAQTAAAPPPPPTETAPPAAGDRVVDRVVAVVDEDPILLSNLEEVIGLGLAQRKPDESDEAFRSRVLDGLVDERLRFHEVDRFGFAQVPVNEIEARVAEIRSRYPSDEEFAARLRQVGLTDDELRQLVARQLEVLTYVDERLGAKVFVSLDDVRDYYRTTLVPKLKGDKQPVPELDDVREQIRALLKQQRLNDEIDRWTEKLRGDADVQLFLDQPQALPPVVQRFATPQPDKP